MLVQMEIIKIKPWSNFKYTEGGEGLEREKNKQLKPGANAPKSITLFKDKLWANSVNFQT